MSPNEKTLKKLAEVSASLNAKTDALNESIFSLEEKLNEMKIGVSVWLTEPPHFITTDGPFELEEYDHRTQETQRVGQYEKGYCLGYCKYHDQGWKICVRGAKWFCIEDVRNDIEFTGDIRCLTDASREVRVKSAPLLDNLIEALVEQAEEYLESVDSARKSM